MLQKCGIVCPPLIIFALATVFGMLLKDILYFCVLSRICSQGVINRDLVDKWLEGIPQGFRYIILSPHEYYKVIGRLELNVTKSKQNTENHTHKGIITRPKFLQVTYQSFHPTWELAFGSGIAGSWCKLHFLSYKHQC